LALCLLALAAWVPRALGQAPATGQYHAYPLRHKPAAEVEKILVEMLVSSSPETQVLSDARNNQILVRGPAQAQRTAQELIASVDRAAEPAAAEKAEKGVVKSYVCVQGRQNEAAEKLKTAYAGRDDFRVAVDPKTGELLVFASPKVHTEIERQASAFQSKIADKSGDPRRPARLDDSLGTMEQFVPLVRLPAVRMETMLRDLLGQRIVPLGAPEGEPRIYRLVDASGRRVDLAFDRSRSGVRITGAAALTGQFVRLIRELDGGSQTEGRIVEVVPVHNADPTKVQQAVEAYRTGAGQSSPRPLIPSGSDGRASHAGIELTSYLLQAPAPAAGAAPSAAFPPAGAAASAAMPGAAVPKGPEQPTPAQPGDQERRERLRQLAPDVEIETLPDLDVMILRGRDRDVKELKRLIEEIERLSAETQPVIEIYPLKYVEGEELTRIANQVLTDLIAGRQGRVSITPLVRPNALLLIGWGDAVKAAKELISRLDTPISPEAEQRIFRLKYASATAMRATIQEFFQGRSAGLGPRVHVTADPRTNSLVVNAAPRDMAEVALLIQRLDTDTAGAVLQTRVFKLQNTLASDVYITLQGAIEAARGGGAGGQKSAALEFMTIDPKGERILKSGILNDVRITPDVRLNTLIVAAPAESMDLLAALVRQLDSPGTVAQIKVFRIINGDANALIRMLRTLLPAPAAVGGPQISSAEGETSLVPLRFSSELRTNSIIAVGSPGDLKIIEALLLRLDMQDAQQRTNKVYRLKNSPANDVATAVNEYLRSQRQLQQAAPGSYSPFAQLESEVVVVPEPVSNSLIISATPRFFKEIEGLVNELDRQPPQVMIQVLIATVTLSDTNQFGIELGLQDSVLFNRSLLDKIFTVTNTTQLSTPSGITTNTQQEIVSATNTPGYNFNSPDSGNSGANKALAGANRVGGQGLSSFSMGRADPTLGYGGLVLSASSESVSVLLRALQQTQRLEVLGRPQIMTLDNQAAFIQIGKRVPRITGTQMNQIGQTNTIDLVNVGLILAVTPRISPEGIVVMEIDAEKSDVGPEAEGVPVSVVGSTVIRSPSFNTTMAQTTVSAQDGETIVLGGLINRQTQKIERKVPYLADIPVLGNLFKYKSNQDQRDELLIILTPHVVRGAEETERIKRLESSRMHWCLADVYQIHGDAGLTQNGGQVVYPDSNPRGLPASDTPVKPSKKSKTDKEEAPPGLEAVPPSLPLPDSSPPIPVKPSKASY
jgi:general secretion pathway protein D